MPDESATAALAVATRWGDKMLMLKNGDRFRVVSVLAEDGGHYTEFSTSFVKLCSVEIPGIGYCEHEDEDHPSDKHGRRVHKRGPCTWNGDLMIEVVPE